MQLIECYIENFGKFNKYHKSFTAGLNEIFDDNGWGKSTLAAFIKVMLYGFDDEKKRTGEKERKKYEPWQGGEYGGRLTIQTEEGCFTICRTFGKTEKNDEFKMLDASTGAESTRFSKEVGKELFQIDRDTFFNTLYIAQTDRKAQVTNDIHARIGSQDHILEDISGYQEVEKRIKDELNHANPKRKGGFLYDLEKRLSEMRHEQEKLPELEATVERRREQLREAKRQKAVLQDRVKLLQEQRSRISSYEGLAEKKKYYEELLKEKRTRREMLKQAENVFPGKLPEKEDSRNLQSLADRLQTASQQEELCRLTDGEQQELKELSQRFSGCPPTEETLSIYADKHTALQRLRMELAAQKLTEAEEEQLRRYQEIFTESIPTAQFEQQIENTRICAKLQNALQEKRMTLHAVSIAQRQADKEKQEAARGKIVWQLPVGVLCVLAGIFLGILWDRLIGVLVLFAGIIVCGWGLYAGKKAPDTEAGVSVEASGTEQLRAEIAEEEQQTERLLKEVHQFLSVLHNDCPDQEMDGKLYELKAEYNSYKMLLDKKARLHALGTEEQVSQLQRELYEFLQQYMPLEAENAQMFDSALRALEQDAQRYRQLNARKQSWQQAEASRSKARGELETAFRELSMLPEKNIRQQLNELNEHIQQYEQCAREAKQAERRITTFSEQENVEALMALKAPENMQTAKELDEQIRSLEQQITAQSQSIEQYGRALELSAGELDQLAAAAEELKELEEQYARVSQQYEVLKLTQTYLDEAKTNLTNRYTKPLLDSLKKNYEILSDGEECHYTMDANIRVSLDIGSIPKELSALSMGYQDLSWICMRLAFIEAMYQNEKPFMIMDDPLVNMDENKIKGGKRLLKQLAKDYQVLYFTCHRSRSVNASGNA